MRSRKRLAEVAETLGEATGPVAMLMLNMAADVITGSGTAEAALVFVMDRLAREHESEHVRQMAREAAIYLRLPVPTDNAAFQEDALPPPDIAPDVLNLKDADLWFGLPDLPTHFFAAGKWQPLDIASMDERAAAFVTDVFTAGVPLEAPEAKP